MKTNYRRIKIKARKDFGPTYFGYGHDGRKHGFKRLWHRAERRRPLPSPDGDPQDLQHRLPNRAYL